jgi:hypothetical protein
MLSFKKFIKENLESKNSGDFTIDLIYKLRRYLLEILLKRSEGYRLKESKNKNLFLKFLTECKN